ncbi:hypothetical protein TruAng_004872 [Truncatella angustata]|nr:hypothetical protein TruAng_004872 [Truncatella angustata]
MAPLKLTAPLPALPKVRQYGRRREGLVFVLLLAFFFIYKSAFIDVVGHTKIAGHAQTCGPPDAEAQHIAPLAQTIPSGDRLAMIVESNASRSPNLIPIMLHFATVLGPAWSVVLFTLEEHWEVPSSPAFARAVQRRQIEVRYLPPATELMNSRNVSTFLTRPWIWEQVGSARRVLMFQSDSVICSRAANTVEDFFEYDFIGAPVDAKYGVGYSGGLSLRNPKFFLAVTREADVQRSPEQHEDEWFYTEARRRADQGVTLPTQRVAGQFSVGSIYYPKPLSYHQPGRWQHDKMKEIRDWCPEVGILTEHRVV